MSGVRVRFAPSPTGHLHIGGARTALFNWLFARGLVGEFLLRIEDTDVERSSSEMVASIMESLRWLGLVWDGEPMFQSTRVEKHRQVAFELMKRGKAYPCFCRPDESDPKTYIYPRTCRSIDPGESRKRMEAGEPYAVRFSVPGGTTEFHDLVYGRITVDHQNIDDFVLLRREGTPTYQLAVVVDDIDMDITHVIRGDGHLSNTPKQILLYEALGRNVPEFAHLPLILGSDKKPLAKRHGATSITSYRDMGYLPQAVVNFLALLGWSPGDDREVLSIEQLKERFSLDRVTRKGAVFDIQKLEWLNGQYISGSTPGELFDEVVKRWIDADLMDAGEVEGKKEWLFSLIDLLKSRMRLLSDFVEAAKPYLTDDFPYDEGAVKKRWKKPVEVVTVLSRVGEELEHIDDFGGSSIEERVRGVAGTLGLSNSKVFHPVRIALTGRMAGPGLFELMEVIGRDGCMKRLARAVNHLKGRTGSRQGA